MGRLYDDLRYWAKGSHAFGGGQPPTNTGTERLTTRTSGGTPAGGSMQVDADERYWELDSGRGIWLARPASPFTEYSALIYKDVVASGTVEVLARVRVLASSQTTRVAMLRASPITHTSYTHAALVGVIYGSTGRMAFSVEAGSGGTSIQSAVGTPITEPAWAWARFRFEDEGTRRYLGKFWYGPLADEPAAWLLNTTSLSAVNQIGASGPIGFFPNDGLSSDPEGTTSRFDVMSFGWAGDAPPTSMEPGVAPPSAGTPYASDPDTPPLPAPPNPPPPDGPIVPKDDFSFWQEIPNALYEPRPLTEATQFGLPRWWQFHQTRWGFQNLASRLKVELAEGAIGGQGIKLVPIVHQGEYALLMRDNQGLVSTGEGSVEVLARLEVAPAWARGPGITFVVPRPELREPWASSKRFADQIRFAVNSEILEIEQGYYSGSSWAVTSVHFNYALSSLPSLVAGEMVWLRLRLQRGATEADDALLVKIWKGGYASEPINWHDTKTRSQIGGGGTFQGSWKNAGVGIYVGNDEGHAAFDYVAFGLNGNAPAEPPAPTVGPGQTVELADNATYLTNNGRNLKGPFSYQGTVFTLARPFSNIHAFSSVNGVDWGPDGSIALPDSTVRAMATAGLPGSNLFWLAIVDGLGDVRVASYNMATKSWSDWEVPLRVSVTFETHLSIVAQAGGGVVVVVDGDPNNNQQRENIMGTSYQRIVVTRRSPGGGWTQLGLFTTGNQFHVAWASAVAHDSGKVVAFGHVGQGSASIQDNGTFSQSSSASSAGVSYPRNDVAISLRAGTSGHHAFWISAKTTSSVTLRQSFIDPTGTSEPGSPTPFTFDLGMSTESAGLATHGSVRLVATPETVYLVAAGRDRIRVFATPNAAGFNFSLLFEHIFQQPLSALRTVTSNIVTRGQGVHLATSWSGQVTGKGECWYYREFTLVADPGEGGSDGPEGGSGTVIEVTSVGGGGQIAPTEDHEGGAGTSLSVSSAGAGFAWIQLPLDLEARWVDGDVHLTWNEDSVATKYEIERQVWRGPGSPP